MLKKQDSLASNHSKEKGLINGVQENTEKGLTFSFQSFQSLHLLSNHYSEIQILEIKNEI